MEQLAMLLEKLAPKEMASIGRRFDILHGIALYEPVGRRLLSQKLELSEKIIRNETEFLRAEGLIEVDGNGMGLSEKGAGILEGLSDFFMHLEGLKGMEEKVKRIIGCRHLVLVQGNADVDAGTEALLGESASKELLRLLKDDHVIAITGGMTVKSVVEATRQTYGRYASCLVVPARGSIGSRMEIQANSLVALLASRLQCGYKLLNIPDNLSQASIENIIKEPEIRDVLETAKNADVVLFGIGQAESMAHRRQLDKEAFESLMEKKAVGEVLGFYYNSNGEAVFNSRSVGIKTGELKPDAYLIAVAGGESKARAILSARHILKNGSLILDEGAAKKIMELNDNTMSH